MKVINNTYIIICLILTVSVILTAQSSISVNKDSDHISIGNKIEILEDQSGTYIFDDILSQDLSRKFISSETDEPNFGFTSSVYWVRFRLANSDSGYISRYLELSYPLIDDIKMFVPDKNGGWTVKTSGDHHPFSSREISHRNFIFKLNVKPGTQTYYMRFMTTSSMNLPLSLWSEKSLINKIGFEQILFGIFFGAVIIMIVYNIFLFIGLKDISFIYLFLFIASWGFAQLTIDGLSYQYLWSGLTWWSDVNLPVFIFISLAAAVQFCRSLLSTEKMFPLWDRLLKIEKNIFIIGIFLSLFLSYSLSIRLAAGTAIPAIVSLTLTGIAGLKRRNRSAFIFMAAWGLFFAGAMLFAFKSFGLLPSSIITNFSVQIGFFAMMVLLSISVQDRVESEKKQKEKAREQLIDALKESEKVLETRVDERTQEINRINILLMDRAIELAGINRLTEKVNSTLRLSDVLQFTCEELNNIFNIRYSAIYLLDEGAGKFVLAAFYSNEKDQAPGLVQEFYPDADSAVNTVAETKLPISLPAIPPALSKGDGEGGVLIIPVISLKKAVGFIILSAAETDHKFSKDETDLSTTIAIQIAGAVQNAKQYSETEDALGVAERDLEIGREIQSGFFPSSIPPVPGWEIAAYFKGARQVAGDFYDVFRLEDSKLTAFIIADVCDKGVGAALFMVVFRSLLRAYSERGISALSVEEDLKKVVSETNNYIAVNHNSSNMFASLFFGIIDHKSSDIYYVNAGHDAPVLVNVNGTIVKRLMPTGPVVGMFPDMQFEAECLHMEKGDILFTFTDGSTDARSENNELFTEDRLLGIAGAKWTSAYSMLSNVNHALKKHTGSSSQFDDITQLAVRRKLSEQDNIFAIERDAYPENLEELRDFVESAAIHQQLDKEIAFALKLAAEEICSNIINYGFGEVKGKIKLSMEIFSDEVILKISDNGMHFPPDQAELPDINADYENRKTGGLGIHLVKELMDETAYMIDENDYNVLILKKKLNYHSR